MNKKIDNIKYLIFDMDGTLVDSMPEWSKEMINILVENNIEVPDKFVENIVTKGAKEIADVYISMGVKASNEEMLEKYQDFAFHKYETSIPAKPNAYEVISKLKEKGYSINVLSSTSKPLIDVCFKRLKMFDFFDNVWSCNYFNCSKADPKIYLEIAKSLNTDISNCALIDDSINALKTAKVAGMNVYGIYDEFSKYNEEKIRGFADGYFTNLLEILNVF